MLIDSGLTSGQHIVHQLHTNVLPALSLLGINMLSPFTRGSILLPLENMYASTVVMPTLQNPR